MEAESKFMKCLWRLMIWSGILFTAQNIYRCGKKEHAHFDAIQENFSRSHVITNWAVIWTWKSMHAEKLCSSILTVQSIFSFKIWVCKSITITHTQLTSKLFVVRPIFPRASQHWLYVLIRCMLHQKYSNIIKKIKFW